MWLICCCSSYLTGKPELNLDDNQESENALDRLVQKWPDLEQLLRQKINLSAVFETWYESLSNQSDRLLTEAVFWSLDRMFRNPWQPLLSDEDGVVYILGVDEAELRQQTRTWVKNMKSCW